MNNKKSKVLGVIPARIGSTRIPNKMLADLGGKSLIQRTIERTKKASSLDAFIVATDSEEIATSAQQEGAEVIMWDTPLLSKNGTEGVAHAVNKFETFKPDIIVNIWGDEPLYPAEAIDKCVQLLIDDSDLQVATVGDLIRDFKMVEEPSIVQVLTDLNDNVLCFSRCPVPYSHTDEDFDHHHVIGVLSMRIGFMDKFLNLPQTPIELREGVEQMRILEHGYRMKIVKGDYRNLGVNTPEELEEVRKIYQQKTDRGEDG